MNISTSKQIKMYVFYPISIQLFCNYLVTLLSLFRVDTEQKTINM
jgi:hypothetical protein